MSLCTSYTDSAGEKQDDYSSACSCTIYCVWNKTIIILLNIDLIDFPFSAQDLNSLPFFSDWNTLNVLAAPGGIQQISSSH